jgi:ribosome-binding protein aMBF1 (putative translation factor)
MDSAQSEQSYERLLRQETLIMDATETICEAMQEQGISRSDLARKIGKSKGFVSQVLSGKRNMRLRTLADMATALDIQIVVRRRDA